VTWFHPGMVRLGEPPSASVVLFQGQLTGLKAFALRVTGRWSYVAWLPGLGLHSTFDCHQRATGSSLQV